MEREGGIKRLKERARERLKMERELEGWSERYREVEGSCKEGCDYFDLTRDCKLNSDSTGYNYNE